MVFFDDGGVFVKDWLFGRSDVDMGEVNRGKDLRQIGIILASVATLVPESQL